MLLLTHTLGTSGISAQAVEMETDHACHTLDMVGIRSIWDHLRRAEKFPARFDHMPYAHIVVNQSKVIHPEATSVVCATPASQAHLWV